MPPPVNIPNLSIVESLGLFELGGKWEIQQDSDSIALLHSSGLTQRITCAYGDFDEPLENFIVLPTFQKYSHESEIVHLRFQNERMGYVIPDTSLVGGEVLTGKFDRLFASAAIKAVLFGSVAKDMLRPVLFNNDRLADLAFNDLFDRALSFAVLPRQSLATHSISLDDVKYMLSSEGFLTDWPSQGKLLFSTPYERTLPMKLPSSALRNESGILNSLLCIAVTQTTPRATFILLYQVLELLISRIFQCEMQDQIAAFRNCDLWELKEKINELSREVYRLNQLENKYLRNFPRRALFIDCRDACERFLQDLHITPKRDNWATLLYTTRNVIVHRQHEFNRFPEDHLGDVCISLRELVVNIASSFVEVRNCLWHRYEGSDVY